jgi:hypothetical protein
MQFDNRDVICCLTLCLAFAVYVQLRLMLSLHFIVNHYILRHNWPSSRGQVFVLKESDILLFYCKCFWLFLHWYRDVSMQEFGLCEQSDRLC